MLTVKLTDVQMQEIDELLRRDLAILPAADKWIVRERLGDRVIAVVNDELSAFILRDDIIASAMEILKRANQPRSYLFGGDAA
jgi:hypothetical protein